MKDIKFNFRSFRSEKARISVGFGSSLVFAIKIITVISIVFGLWATLLGYAIGWAVIGLSILPAMVVEWYEGELKDLKPNSPVKSIDDMLSVDVLGRLSNHPTPREVASVVGNLYGGQFLAVRFGIGSGLLQELASDNEIDMSAIWENALEICSRTNNKIITPVILTAALLKSYQNNQAILNHLQLEFDDLIKGINWYDYLIDLVKKHQSPKRNGGIARDWSFGWVPLLNNFGINISQQAIFGNMPQKVEAHNQSIDQLIDVFSKNGRQNALLVGSAGVGKTEVVYAFAARLLDSDNNLPNNLKYRQVFVLDSSSLIAAASGRGELEKLIPRILVEAYRAKNVIICLDNAQLFFDEGVGSIDISNILMPILEAGNLRIILTMDEQDYIKISSKNSQLINVLNRISILPATKEETIAVMQDRAIALEFQNHVTFMYQSLVESYRLGDRYVYDLSMPGKALKVLEAAVHYSENGIVTAKSVQQSIEKSLNVKISVAGDEQEKEKLLNLEKLIHERMINQNRAVSVVSDAIRRARMGVRNINRPIGTFLFLGPTGVGKTELAKALAAVYFNGEDKIIRIDLNEYVKSSDVARLIADGGDNSTSLTSRIMKQPFSVVLLDEIEKAHPSVLATLLQMLDEGILRDAKNREISFRDSIVVATSNAGADMIREYIERGYDIEKFEDKLIDGLINSNQFRPEFLNRFDEIVMFRPLQKEELIKVVDLMVADVNRTLSLQKIKVNVDIDAKKYLVEAGYDPRLGARPIRRIVQRVVENIVAKQMLMNNICAGSEIDITLEQVQQMIGIKNAADQIMIDQK